MDWLFWTLSNALNLSLSRVIQKKEMTGLEDKSRSFAFIFQIGPGLILLALMIGFGQPFPDFRSEWIYWLISSLSFSLGSFALFKAYALSEVSQVTVLFTFRIIITMLLAYTFLDQEILPNEIMGAAIIILGVLVMLFNGKKLKLNKGNSYALLAAVLFGIAFANEPILLKTNSPLTVIATEFMLGAIVMTIISFKSVKDVPIVLKTTSPLLMTIAISIYAFGAYSLLAAYNSGGTISQVIPVSQLSRVFAVLFGYLLLNERSKMPQKIIGVILGIVGTLVIRFG